MDRIETFSEFLATQNAQIDLSVFAINLLATMALAHLLAVVYARRGSALSNRAAFGRIFVPIAATTMLIIVLVKSSLALSLGLVGALSIVRFRAAIKEPEELSYLFIAIALGLGFGANQATLTLLAFGVLMVFILLRRVDSGGTRGMSLILSREGTPPDLDRVVAILKQASPSVALKRLDHGPDRTEAVFALELAGFEAVQTARAALMELDPELRFTLLDDAAPGSL